MRRCVLFLVGLLLLLPSTGPVASGALARVALAISAEHSGEAWVTLRKPVRLQTSQSFVDTRVASPIATASLRGSFAAVLIIDSAGRVRAGAVAAKSWRTENGFSLVYSLGPLDPVLAAGRYRVVWISDGGGSMSLPLLAGSSTGITVRPTTPLAWSGGFETLNTLAVSPVATTEHVFSVESGRHTYLFQRATYSVAGQIDFAWCADPGVAAAPCTRPTEHSGWQFTGVSTTHDGWFAAGTAYSDPFFWRLSPGKHVAKATVTCLCPQTTVDSLFFSFKLR